LIEAARFGHNDVVRALVAAGAKPGIINAQGQTALVLAAQNGHTETVQLLKQAGAIE
jgi:ankyrin repeat protein